MISLQTITIRRFKKLEDFSFDLQDINVLIGANNSGKSSVLHAVHFAISLAQTSKLLGGVTWRQDKFEISFSPGQLLYSPTSDVLSLATGGMLVEDVAKKVEITLTAQSGEKCVISLRRGRNRNIQVSLEGKDLGEKLQDITSPYTIYAPGLAGISREENFIAMGRLRRIVARGDANLVLRNILLELQKNTQDWKLFLTDMRGLFPKIEFDSKYDSSTDETIDSRFRYDEQSPWLPIDAAGTAILQSIQLIGYAVLFKPKLMILDEPDSHLHPNNQRRLCNLIKYLSSTRELQVLLSTHSRHVFNEIEGPGTQILWVNSGKKLSGHQDDVARLLDLGALDSLDYFASGQVKCAVISEDADTSMLECVLESNGFDMDQTEILAYAGCSKLETAIALGRFLKEKTNNVQVIVHIDRDYRSQKELNAISESLTKNDLDSLMTSGTDIESHFINPKHINYVYPAINITDAEILITEAITETKTKSIEKMINSRTVAAFKLRNETGENPNHGAIAIAASTEYERDPPTFFHGKTVLGTVNAKLQVKLQANPKLVTVSEHLKVTNLTDLAAKLWT